MAVVGFVGFRIGARVIAYPLLSGQVSRGHYRRQQTPQHVHSTKGKNHDIKDGPRRSHTSLVPDLAGELLSPQLST